MNADQIFTQFDDLPEWLKKIIPQISDDYRTWIQKPVPALGNRSLVAVMNSGAGGEREVRDYLRKVEGKFDFRFADDI